LIALIQGARKRIVFIAPGVHEPVALALGTRFREIDGLDVTVVVDPDEDVCRIGYGDAKGLELVNTYARENGFWVRAQPGLRVGVLLADEKTLVWSPTPRSVEAPPSSAPRNLKLTQEPEPAAPNGLMLGANPADQLSKAVAAEGVDANPNEAEIGKSAVTPERVEATLDALRKNPPIPVDLARVTRVFSTKLQFVELEIKGAKLSQTQLTVPNDLLNADAKGELQGLIRSKLRAFSDFKNVEVPVPAFLNGERLTGKDGTPLLDQVSEATLQRSRTAVEKRFIYDITGYGRLIAKDEKAVFVAQVEAIKIQLLEHSKKLRLLIGQQAEAIVDEAVDLIMDRARRSVGKSLPKVDDLREVLRAGLTRSKDEEPKVSLVFKDVTFEQTKSEDFRKRVAAALPAHKREQLGNWTEHFEAAREAAPEK
jgi:hypothetical protein